VSIDPGVRFVTSADTWLIMVGRNNANAYKGAALPAYINTNRENLIKEVKVEKEKDLAYS
jgi:hypothetical protein